MYLLETHTLIWTILLVEDGSRAGRLMGEHLDPFNRMIAAQALADDIPVISLDEKLDQSLIRRLW